MAFKCQYDLQAHLGHIITFLLHPRKFILFCAGERVRLKTDMMKIASTFKKRDIDQ